MSKLKKRSRAFDRLTAGLREGIEFARGERELKTTVVLDAVVRNGRLRVDQAVGLADGTPLRVTISPATSAG